MNGIITIIVAIIGSGLINTMINIFLTRKTKNDEEVAALRVVMKDRLRFLCRHYINQGWIYEDEREDLIKMHICYHDTLHGNGYLDDLMTRVKALEVRGIGVS